MSDGIHAIVEHSAEIRVEGLFLVIEGKGAIIPIPRTPETTRVVLAWLGMKVHEGRKND